MAPDELRRRAIIRALARRSTAAVRRIRLGVYQVRSASRPSEWHTVTVEGRGWRCTCEASLAGRPCWHQALIFVLKTEAGGGRVTGPVAGEGDPDVDRELELDDLGAAA